jgi:hypothetical protein
VPPGGGQILAINNIAVLPGTEVGAIHDNRPPGDPGTITVNPDWTNLVYTAGGPEAAELLEGRILEVDPRLQSDYCIDGNSPAINEGGVDFEGLLDVDNRARPGETVPDSPDVDLGACEYSGVIFVGPFLRGDCNGDLSFDVIDPLFLLFFNFGDIDELPCRAACDATGDGAVSGDTSDAISMLMAAFLAGPSLPPPFPIRGGSTIKEDFDLGCEEI